MRFFFRITDASSASDDATECLQANHTVVPVPNRQPGKPDLVDENVPPKKVAKDTSQSNKPAVAIPISCPKTAIPGDAVDKVSVPVLYEDNKNKPPPSSKSKVKADNEKAQDKAGKIPGVEKLKNCIVLQYVGNAKTPKQRSKEPSPNKPVENSTVPSKRQTPPSPKQDKAESVTQKPPEPKSPSKPPAQKLPSPKPPPLVTSPTPTSSPPKCSPPKSPPLRPKIGFPSSPEIDMEKSQFLECIQLTAKSNVTPEKLEFAKAQKTLSPLIHLPRIEMPFPRNPLPLKRPAIGPAKSPKKCKVPKRENATKRQPAKSKKVQNPIIRQMLGNGNHQQVSSLRQDASKIVGHSASETNSELKSLFDSCKINIPSSLSITLKETCTNDSNNSKAPTSIKPVQNYIEILKLPDQTVVAPKAQPETKPQQKAPVQNGHDSKNNKTSPEPTKLPNKISPKDSASKTATVDTSVSPSVAQKLPLVAQTVKIVNSLDPAAQDATKKNQGQQLGTPNLAQMLQNTPHALPKTAATGQSAANESAAKSFQKMFEEAVKNDFNKVAPNFAQDKSKKGEGKTAANRQTNALDLTTGNVAEGHVPHNKRNIAEIAQQLYKKTKMEQEKQLNNNQVNGKVAIPRLPQPQSRLNVPQPIQTFQSYVNQQRNQTPPIDAKPQTKSPQKSPSIASQKSPSLPPTLTLPNQPQTIKSPSSASPKSSGQSLAPKSSPKLQLSPKCGLGSPALGDLSPNQLLEKYNIPNLAQLSANFNLAHAGHLALQQAYVLKQFELQNKQNWLNMNPNLLAVQYEKFFQNLNPQGHQLLGNKSEH